MSIPSIETYVPLMYNNSIMVHLMHYEKNALLIVCYLTLKRSKRKGN